MARKTTSRWDREKNEKYFNAFKARFRSIMEEKDFGLCSSYHTELDIAPQTLRSYRHGGLPSIETFFRICKYTYYNLNWLFKGEGPQRVWAGESFPCYAQKICVQDEDDDDDPIDEESILVSGVYLKKIKDGIFLDRQIFSDISASYDCAFMSISEDAFAPVINKGDLVLFDKDKTTIIPGGIYLVMLNSKILLRQVVQRNAGISLVAENKSYPTIRIKKEDKLYIIGRVLWSCRSYGFAPLLDK